MKRPTSPPNVKAVTGRATKRLVALPNIADSQHFTTTKPPKKSFFIFPASALQRSGRFWPASLAPPCTPTGSESDASLLFFSAPLPAIRAAPARPTPRRVRVYLSRLQHGGLSWRLRRWTEAAHFTPETPPPSIHPPRRIYQSHRSPSLCYHLPASPGLTSWLPTAALTGQQMATSANPAASRERGVLTAVRYDSGR